MVRLSASTATLGLTFALVNLGLLAYMGAPLPPEPYLSMLIVFTTNLLLFTYTPLLIHLLQGAGAQRGSSGSSNAVYHALEDSTNAGLSVSSAPATRRMVWRTRILIYLENWFTILVRGSFKDGHYTTEYHTDGFIVPMVMTGFIGGVVCLIVWFNAGGNEAAPAAAPRPATTPVVATENGEGIELAHNATPEQKV